MWVADRFTLTHDHIPFISVVARCYMPTWSKNYSIMQNKIPCKHKNMWIGGQKPCCFIPLNGLARNIQILQTFFLQETWKILQEHSYNNFSCKILARFLYLVRKALLLVQDLQDTCKIWCKVLQTLQENTCKIWIFLARWFLLGYIPFPDIVG